MADSSADRNLLFGILALQMDFITRDALDHRDEHLGLSEGQALRSGPPVARCPGRGR